jgi:hypothetical protein
MKSQEIWKSVIFPTRSIKLLRPFSKSPTDYYFEFRPNGWMVQGLDKDIPYGSEYEITQRNIEENFSQQQFFAILRKLFKLRFKFQIYYK